jgi:hypothetical protein
VGLLEIISADRGIPRFTEHAQQIDEYWFDQAKCKFNVIGIEKQFIQEYINYTKQYHW